MALFGKMLKLFKDQKDDVPKLGRNDPCWCGSGKKYKRCHLEHDQKRLSKKRALNCGPT